MRTTRTTPADVDAVVIPAEVQSSPLSRHVSRVVVAVTAAVACLVIGAPQAHAAPLPVSYSFFAGIGPALAHPYGSLPGSNDYRCRPTAQHPRPVVLVHGTGGSAQTNWGTYVPLLKNNGYCVFALTYGAIPGAPAPLNLVGGMGRIEASAHELGVFVDGVLRATGATKVDIVGHSQGTLMPDWYAKFLGGARFIDKYVSLAPLWRGTGGDVAAAINPVVRRLGIDETAVPICAACGQMTTGSRLLAHLDAGGSPYVAGISYTNISTTGDELVLPYTSGQVRGRAGDRVTNIVVQRGCAQDHSDHLAVAASRRAATLVLNALDPESPRPVPCDPVLPIVG